MNYKRGLFSLVAATLLGSSAVADTSAVYLPLSTASHDASWILFGVNGFSSGVQYKNKWNYIFFIWDDGVK